MTTRKTNSNSKTNSKYQPFAKPKEPHFYLRTNDNLLFYNLILADIK